MLLFYFPIVFSDVTGFNSLHGKLFRVYYNGYIDYIVIEAYELKKLQ